MTPASPALAKLPHRSSPGSPQGLEKTSELSLKLLKTIHSNGYRTATARAMRPSQTAARATPWAMRRRVRDVVLGVRVTSVGATTGVAGCVRMGLEVAISTRSSVDG